MAEQNSATRVPRKTIILDGDAFAVLASTHGWKSNAAIARAVGMPERTVDRIVKGSSPISIEFIAGVLEAAPLVGFRRVFKSVPAPDQPGKEK
jgi:hypothetical protein